MVTYVTIHRGSDVGSAKLVAATSSPELVAAIAGILLEEMDCPPGDIVLWEVDQGRRRALRMIANLDVQSVE